ncbi:MAG: hypothetical protein ACUZ8H_04375, partial [Candidatus Anammoxibacter sp.]
NAASKGAFPYSYGYHNIGGKFQTIMSTDNSMCCTHVPFWSNPDIMRDGIPMGVPEGEPDAADNRKTLNNTALTVANFGSFTDIEGKSFTFNCEHSMKRGFFFGLETLTMNLGDTENCTLKLTNHEPGKIVEIETQLMELFGSAIKIEPTSGEADENGELKITLTALRKGINWAAWAVPNDRGQFLFNMKTYDTGLAWGMFVEVK